MRILGSAAGVIHAHVGRALPLLWRCRLKHDALSMIFQEQGNVWEELAQLGAKFLELEFVNMERIGTGVPSRFRIIKFVGSRNDKLTRRRERASRLPQKAAPILQMLDHFEGDHQVDRSIRRGQRGAVGFFKTKIGRRILRPSECDRFT